MRLLSLLCLACFLPLLPQVTSAQSGRTVAVVVLPEAEVLGGPSRQFPTVGMLRAGDRVAVIDEVGGWVAIVPPSDSISWINHRYLGELDPHKSRQNAMVLADNVEVRLGMVGKREPLSVRTVTLPRGTIVEVIGPKVAFDNSTWYPIAPPPGERRYIPRDAVNITQATVVASSPEANASGIERTLGDGEGIPGMNGVLPIGSDGRPLQGELRNWLIRHPLWQRSEHAEQSGNYLLAEGCLTQLIDDIKHQDGDNELVVACLNRNLRIREKMRREHPLARPLDGSPPAPNAPPAPLPPYGSGRPVQGLAASRPSRTGPQAVPPQPMSDPAMLVAQLVSSGPGVLKRSSYLIDGLRAYVLQGRKGELVLYATAQRGVDLEAVVGQEIELIGPIVYRGDLRNYYMTVVRVNSVR